jgi:hypothetical protein
LIADINARQERLIGERILAVNQRRRSKNILFAGSNYVGFRFGRPACRKGLFCDHENRPSTPAQVSVLRHEWDSNASTYIAHLFFHSSQLASFCRGVCPVYWSSADIAPVM